MCSLINKQLLLTAYAYLFITEQQKEQQGIEALQGYIVKSDGSQFEVAQKVVSKALKEGNGDGKLEQVIQEVIQNAKAKVGKKSGGKIGAQHRSSLYFSNQTALQKEISGAEAMLALWKERVRTYPEVAEQLAKEKLSLSDQIEAFEERRWTKMWATRDLDVFDNKNRTPQLSQQSAPTGDDKRFEAGQEVKVNECEEVFVDPKQKASPYYDLVRGVELHKVPRKAGGFVVYEFLSAAKWTRCHKFGAQSRRLARDAVDKVNCAYNWWDRNVANPRC